MFAEYGDFLNCCEEELLQEFQKFIMYSQEANSSEIF